MEPLTFTVDSALLSELGEKLVEHVHIALVELVKNAYDTDATEVTVRITTNDKNGPTVEVVDNGAGMTFDQVSAYWMRIATTHKRDTMCRRSMAGPELGQKGLVDSAAGDSERAYI